MNLEHVAYLFFQKLIQKTKPLGGSVSIPAPLGILHVKRKYCICPMYKAIFLITMHVMYLGLIFIL